jgi:hypothetical protein
MQAAQRRWAASGGRTTQRSRAAGGRDVASRSPWHGDAAGADDGDMCGLEEAVAQEEEHSFKGWQRV